MYLPKAIESSAFKNVYLKILPPDSSSTINVIAHFSEDKKDPTILTRLIPLVGLPSLVNILSSDIPDETCCAIRSASHENMYFYLDATGVGPDLAEGGNLEAQSWTNVPEMRFVIQKSSNNKLRLAKRDSHQPIFLRINGAGLKAATPDGAVGSAGCKFVTNLKDLMQISFCELLL